MPKTRTEYNRKYRQARKRWREELKSGPCTDCGVQYPPFVMDWDHVSDDKLNGVAKLFYVGASRAVLLAEIAKCELVCANCHRFRTQRRIHTKKEK